MPAFYIALSAWISIIVIWCFCKVTWWINWAIDYSHRFCENKVTGSGKNICLFLNTVSHHRVLKAQKQQNIIIIQFLLCCPLYLMEHELQFIKVQDIIIIYVCVYGATAPVIFAENDWNVCGKLCFYVSFLPMYQKVNKCLKIPSTTNLQFWK